MLFSQWYLGALPQEYLMFRKYNSVGTVSFYIWYGAVCCWWHMTFVVAFGVSSVISTKRFSKYPTSYCYSSLLHKWESWLVLARPGRLKYLLEQNLDLDIFQSCKFCLDHVVLKDMSVLYVKLTPSFKAVLLLLSKQLNVTLVLKKSPIWHLSLL